MFIFLSFPLYKREAHTQFFYSPKAYTSSSQFFLTKINFSQHACIPTTPKKICTHRALFSFALIQLSHLHKMMAIFIAIRVGKFSTQQLMHRNQVQQMLIIFLNFQLLWVSTCRWNPPIKSPSHVSSGGHHHSGGQSTEFELLPW